MCRSTAKTWTSTRYSQACSIVKLADCQPFGNNPQRGWCQLPINPVYVAVSIRFCSPQTGEKYNY